MQNNVYGAYILKAGSNPFKGDKREVYYLVSKNGSLVVPVITLLKAI